MVVLFGGAEWLETRATGRARDAIAAILALKPSTAVLAATGAPPPCCRLGGPPQQPAWCRLLACHVPAALPHQQCRATYYIPNIRCISESNQFNLTKHVFPAGLHSLQSQVASVVAYPPGDASCIELARPV